MAELVHEDVGRELVVRGHRRVEVVDASPAVLAVVDHDLDEVVGRRGRDLAQPRVVEGEHVALGSEGVVGGAHRAAPLDAVGQARDAAFVGGDVDRPDVEVAAALAERRDREEALREPARVARATCPSRRRCSRRRSAAGPPSLPAARSPAPPTRGRRTAAPRDPRTAPWGRCAPSTAASYVPSVPRFAMATSTGPGRLREAHRLVEPARGRLRLRRRHPFPEDARVALREHERAGGGVAHLDAIDALPPVVDEAGRGPGHGPSRATARSAKRSSVAVPVWTYCTRRVAGTAAGGRRGGAAASAAARARAGIIAAMVAFSFIRREPAMRSAFVRRSCSRSPPCWPGRPSGAPRAAAPRARPQGDGGVAALPRLAGRRRGPVGRRQRRGRRGGDRVCARRRPTRPPATSAAAASSCTGPASGERGRLRLPRDGARRRARRRCGWEDGTYDPARHHESHLAVGVPGTVAGLHMAWKEQGKLPWRRLVEPADRCSRAKGSSSPTPSPARCATCCRR